MDTIDKNSGQKDNRSSNSQLILWRDDFVKSKSVRWAPNTKRSYLNAINLYITHVGEDHWPPSRVNVLEWLESVKQRTSEITTASYWRHVRAWFNYLEIIDVLDTRTNPTHMIKKLKLQPVAPKPEFLSLDKEELEQLFSYLEKLPFSLFALRDLALLRFQYISGARCCEVASLSRKDLHLSDELPCAHIQAKVSKNKKFRVVYVNDQVRNNLNQWIDALKTVDYTGDAIFPTLYNGTPGKAITAEGIYRMFQRRLVQAEMERRRAHTLRHSSALHAIADGIDLRKVRDQLGHSSIVVTAGYLKQSDPDRGQAYKNWGKNSHSPKSTAND